jgi:formate C-acetyltransferase
MDRKGLTALIQSAAKTNPSLFPDGSVLDFVLHPSAVAGEDGLDAFLSLLKVYFAKGGYAMHGNVFCAEDLKAAQANPEKYANLQVRVCGWNAYFVNLTKDQQDAFIKQAEKVV